MVASSDNIKQLITFFEVNKQIPLEQLKDSALKTGYSREEVDAASKNLSTQQTVASAQTPAAVTDSTIKPGAAVGKKAKIALISLAALALLGTVAASYAALHSNSAESKASSTGKTTAVTLPTSAAKPASPSATLLPLPSVSPPPTVINPLSGYAGLLAESAYRVDTHGKLSMSDSSATSSSSLTLNLDGAAFYLKKGQLLRADLVEEGTNQSLLLANNNLYFMDHATKTVSQLNASGKPVTEAALYPLFRYSLPVIGLLEAQEQGRLVWQKNSDSEWQTEWVYPLFAQGSNKPLAIKIALKGRVLTTFSLKKDATSSWQDIELNYTRLATIDADLALPKDYQVASLAAALAPPPTPSVSLSPTPKK